MFIISVQFNEFGELTSTPFIGKILLCLFERPGSINGVSVWVGVTGLCLTNQCNTMRVLEENFLQFHVADAIGAENTSFNFKKLPVSEPLSFGFTDFPRCLL